MNLKRIKFVTWCVFNGADYKPGETAVVDGSEKGLDVVLGAGFAEVLKEEEPDEDSVVIPSQFPPLDALEAGDADSAALETEDEPESVPEEKPAKTSKKRKKK